jgi:hypothetical protein
MALAFGLVLEQLDPASRWKPFWDSFPEDVHSIFDLEVRAVTWCCIYCYTPIPDDLVLLIGG